MANEIKKYANFESLQVFKENADRIYALKSEIGNVDLSAYETKEDSQLKYDELESNKQDKNLIVRFTDDTHKKVTHTVNEIAQAAEAGTTVKLFDGQTYLNLYGYDLSENQVAFYDGYYLGDFYHVRTCVIFGQDVFGGIVDEKVYFAEKEDLDAKQDILTGTEGQVVQFDADGKAVASDLNLITVDDIDTICGGTIQSAEDVMF